MVDRLRSLVGFTTKEMLGYGKQTFSPFFWVSGKHERTLGGLYHKHYAKSAGNKAFGERPAAIGWPVNEECLIPAGPPCLPRLRSLTVRDWGLSLDCLSQVGFASGLRRGDREASSVTFGSWTEETAQ
jgi:hypothetical protein